MEEMPASFIGPALEQLKGLAEQRLKEQRLSCKAVHTYGTPRRLVLYIEELTPVQKPIVREIKGPAAKVAFDAERKFTRAVYGFAKSQGVDVRDLVVKQVGPVEYVFAVIKQKGQPVEDVLREICPALISDLHFPKLMRWGEGEMRFARPVRWLLALYGEQVIPISAAGLVAGRTTYGHRFLSKTPINIKSPADYFEKMRRAYVLIDLPERRQVIWRQVQELAAGEGGKVEPDQELLDQVANLVEYPVALTGSFDQKYLNLPREVLITTMRGHQRYFPVFGPDSSLLARFIAVSNTGDNELIRFGFERVLRARLADAAFFWKEDLNTPLSSRVDALKRIVWQENLGTLYEKAERITSLASSLAGMLGADEKTMASTLRAAYLAKADLTSSMVYEFPELQGIMGREYALCQGEEEVVARAIAEHYLPRFSGDELPVTLPGCILSLADKLDTLAGCFAIGIQPTGSQDPYALRRHALGICHVILEKKLVISLREMITRTYRGFSGKAKLESPEEQLLSDLEEFFCQRIRNIFSERGIFYAVCDAVLAVNIDDIYGTWQRAAALDNFRKEPAFDDLLVAFHRAYKISQKHYSTAVDVSLLQHPAEQALYRQLIETTKEVQDSLEDRDYREALVKMAGLKQPVDSFFDAVMVMAEDDRIRHNRLGLLRNIINLFLLVADLSKMS